MPLAVTDFEASLERGLKTAGLLGGPLLALVVFAWNPGSHPPEARRLVAVLALAIAWWITEAIPLPATALVAAALAIVLGIAPARQVLAPFADPVIFLFLGSFLLAEALSRFGLDVRLAAWLLGLPLFARTAAGRMAAFGTASATISTVLSNTATAALMTPIAVGALGERKERPTKAESGVLLMIAYGASVGGMATIIGTPPNLLVAGFLERLAGTRVGFTDWLTFGAPIAIVLLLVSLGLTRLVLGRGIASGELADVRPTPLPLETDDASAERRRGAAYTVLAFSLAFALWLAPSLAQGVWARAPGRARAREAPARGRRRSAVPRACCSSPRSPGAERRFALTWEDGQRVNWGVLLLFGGGLSLGTLGETTGIAKWAGESVVKAGLATEPRGLHVDLGDRGRGASASSPRTRPPPRCWCRS